VAARSTGSTCQFSENVVSQSVAEARFPFKRKRLRWQFSRNKRKRQPTGMLGRSSGNHDWLLANASDCV